jgi:hypothetical protein
MKLMMENIFIDNDRPFLDQNEMKDIIKNEKKWNNYKVRLEEDFLKEIAIQRKARNPNQLPF